MATLHFTPDADHGYQRLVDDPARKILLARVDEVLDLIEADPGDWRVRRRRFHRTNFWGVSVHDHTEEWIILWRPGLDNPLDISIGYIGPDLCP